jgi:hypothetical protein
MMASVGGDFVGISAKNLLSRIDMKRSLLATFIACAITSTGWALEYDQTVVAIFGSGNPNTGWTTGSGGGLTLSLRAKNRDDGSTPNAEGVYTFAPGYSANNSALALWNFEFSINSDSQSLSSYDFYLGVDLDPGAGVDYVNSLINPLGVWDNSYGTGNTANGGGVLLANVEGAATVAQNSFNIVFAGLDPGINGTYDFRLFAVAKSEGNSPLSSSGGNVVAQNSTPVADVNIQVIVSAGAPVPDGGGTLAMLGLSLAGLAGISRRRIA